MCIEWEGALTPDGYPRRVYNGNENTRWHRVVCAESLGLTLDDIAGQVVRHTCDNPKCVDPGHLRLGTPADNMRDRDERNRHGAAKLNNEQSALVRTRLDDGEDAKALADEFGVSLSTIYYQRVRNRRIAISAAS